MEPLTLVLLVVLGCVALWRVRAILGEAPRFLRLAFVLCEGAIAILGFAVVALSAAVAAGADGTAVGDRISVGQDGVEAKFKSQFNWVPDADEWSRAAMSDAFGDASFLVEGSSEVVAQVAESSLALQSAAVATFVSGAAVVIAGLLVLRGMLRAALLGRTFQSSSVRALRWLAGIVFFGAVAISIADRLVIGAVIREAGGEGDAYLPWLPTLFWPGVAAVLLLALAEIWRSGIELQKDVEATV